MKKYLVIGTGGVGGSIAGFLALAGKDVTCIARGKHLEAIRKYGLHLKSDLKGEHYLPVKAYTAEEYNDKADVVFVCVKGYSIDSIKDVLEKSAHPDTLVIPILNVYGTGPRIGRLVPSVKVLDGCIYIVGFVSGEGEIIQMGRIFRLIFGARPEQNIPHEALDEIAGVLQSCGIKAEVSDDINRDTSSSGPLSLPWPALEPITMSLWAKYSTMGLYAIPSSAFHAKVLKWDTAWA